MRELTQIEQELALSLANCWFDISYPFSREFYRILKSISPSMHTFITTEISTLREHPSYRKQFPSYEAYKAHLESRIKELPSEYGKTVESSPRSISVTPRSQPIGASSQFAEIPMSATPSKAYDNLCLSIAKTVQDYRVSGGVRITPEHVERWVSQFDEDARLTILQEMDHILAARYISKSRARDITLDMLANADIFGASAAASIKSSEFLKIVRKGSSQLDLLELANDTCHAAHGFHFVTPAQPSQYIYLDDCLFSGLTTRDDITKWVSSGPAKRRLHLVFWAGHTDGRDYLIGRLRRIPATTAWDIRIHFIAYTFDNFHTNVDRYDCLWPSDSEDDPNVENCIKRVNANASTSLRPYFRDSDVPRNETLFSSRQARYVVEQAFLRTGSYIYSLSRVQNLDVRPMGYEKLRSLGFGAMFVTYRNISNNCPLALWWGDPDASADHPFSKWYPLFPREVNHESTADGAGRGIFDADDLPF
jgi:hypothetical protein